MRPIWSGSISFGLVTIPVSLFSASRQRALEFDLIHKKDSGRIQYKKVCTDDGAEVPYEEIIKGYELEDGKYVTLEKEDFQRASPEKSGRIDIEAFVGKEEIDPIYFVKPYYLVPGEGGDKAYVLLREALAQVKKVGVAKVILRERENLVALVPQGDDLMLIDLRYMDEIRDSGDLPIPKSVDVKKEEISMALDLIEKMDGKFEPEKYKNTFVEKLEKLIRDKAKGKKLSPVPPSPKATESSDLVAQLRASLSKHAA